MNVTVEKCVLPLLLPSCSKIRETGGACQLHFNCKILRPSADWSKCDSGFHLARDAAKPEARNDQRNGRASNKPHQKRHLEPEPGGHRRAHTEDAANIIINGIGSRALHSLFQKGFQGPVMTGQRGGATILTRQANRGGRVAALAANSPSTPGANSYRLSFVATALHCRA
jgi:hypothetical protein